MSVSKDEVKKLAELSRIALSEEEVEKIQKEVGSILEYVDVISGVEVSEGVSPSPHLENENVMREDGEPHQSGMYTESILSQAPKREKNFVQVKKILGGE